MLHDLKEEIELEIRELQQLFEPFKLLMIKVKTSDPDTVETVALAGFLHSFYTGIENIFKRIALHLDESIPIGEAWHTQLLDNMASKSKNRPPVISEYIRNQLQMYLQFRHVFRHAYTFNLQWNKMSPLVGECENIFLQFENEISEFLKTIEQE